jgi:2-polyprenyl-6-methoxyphenol hydroxylase-like FAD-dependent oxidoreductase
LTGVAIIGGGPAGLMLAIELGCRGIECVVFDENTTPPHLPKANATSARTMEHYRRRGFADQVRALGLPWEYPQDIVYTTKLAAHELTRFHIPSSSQAASQQVFGDYSAEAWPTPELPHRVQQMYIEPILKAQAEKFPSVRMRFGERVTAVTDRGASVRVEAQDVLRGTTATLEARYAIGCDGPRSIVRQTMGVHYSGEGAAKREFMGGDMLSLYFRSSELYGVLGKDRAWQYWAVNPKQRALLCCIDGIDTFVLMIQLREGQTAADIDPQTVFTDSVGAPFAYDLIEKVPWRAGFALVADTFRKGRLMVAGDAAHLFTPTGGMGYNTSVDDVVNLGWKLAAVLDGWAPESLLDTYEAERRPIAQRNTAFAGSMADSIGRVPVTPLVETEGADGDAARELLGRALAAHVASEFNIPGVQLGMRYTSPIVAVEETPPPPDEPGRYVPSGYPGARAPHRRAASGSLLDRFGRDFTLLVLGDVNAARWERAAREVRVPLTVVRSDDPGTRELYGADAVLVRPDHHIAWRGDGTADPASVLARATGISSTAAQPLRR